jgi:hypothetical protein
MIVGDDILEAAHWFRAENEVAPEVFSLLLFLFRTLDALYGEVLRFPDSWSSSDAAGVRQSGTHNMVISLPEDPEAFALLRSALGLAGDAYCIAKRLEVLETAGAASAIGHLVGCLDATRDARNFFAHLDDRLAPGAEYASVNYRWFASRGTDCLYVDRIVVGRWYGASGARSRIGAVPMHDVVTPATRTGLIKDLFSQSAA